MTYLYMYTAEQLLRTDKTITHRNHKMKGNKIWNNKINEGYSKKRNAYVNFLFQVCSSRGSADKSFKVFDACGQLVFQVKILQEKIN